MQNCPSSLSHLSSSDPHCHGKRNRHTKTQGINKPDVFSALLRASEEVTCRYVPRRQVERMRAELNVSEMRGALIELLGVPKRDKWQLHHIVPLALGGTNDLENFALAQDLPHTHVHNFINVQLHPNFLMPRVLLIPTLKVVTFETMASVLRP